MRHLLRVARPDDLARLALTVDELVAARASDRSHAYAFDVFCGMAGWLQRWAGGCAGKRIVEIGPGFSLAPAALLIAAGAESYTAADLYPLASQDPRFYRAVRADLARAIQTSRAIGGTTSDALARFDDAVAVAADRVVFNPRRLAWICPADAAALPFDADSFDVFLSNAVLEHVQDLGAVITESMRVLAPDAVAIHQVDFRDHRDFSDPLRFLRDDDATWRQRFQGWHQPQGFTNRVRFNDVRDSFAAAGVLLAAEPSQTRPVPESERQQLHAAFRSRDDLHVLGALFVVRKNARLVA